MSLKNDIEEIIFNIGKEIKIHTLIDGNSIIEIEYEKYTNQIINKITKHYPDIKI